MRRQDRRRWAEHVGHGQGRDPTACHCHSTAALSQKRRCRDGDLIQTGQSLLSSKGGRRHQALTLRWWTKTSSEFVVGRHGATGNTSKLVATDRQRQRGPSMAARKSPCPDICCADLVALGQPADRFACARQWLSILGFGVGRSIWACARSHHQCSRFTMHIIRVMRPPCPHDDPTVRPLERCKSRTCSARGVEWTSPGTLVSYGVASVGFVGFPTACRKAG